MKTVYTQLSNILKYIQSPTKDIQIATMPEIVKKRVRHGWGEMGKLSDLCSSSQLVVDPKRNYVFVVHGGGPITDASLAEAINRPKKNLLSINTGSSWYNGMKLTESQLAEFYTRHENKELDCQIYTLSEISKIVSKEYFFDEIISKVEWTRSNPLGLNMIAPQEILLSMITNNDDVLARNYLHKLIEQNISNDCSSGKPLLIKITNPLANYKVKTPFAALISTLKVQDAGFNLETLYTKGFSEWDESALNVALEEETGEDLKTFSMAEVYLLAQEYIPPYALDSFKKNLRAENYRNKEYLKELNLKRSEMK